MIRAFPQISSALFYWLFPVDIDFICKYFFGSPAKLTLFDYTYPKSKSHGLFFLAWPVLNSTILSDCMISMENHVIWNSLKALDNVLSVFTWNSIDAVCVESWLVDMWNTVHPKTLLLLPFNLIHEADFSVALLFLSQPKPSKLCCIDFQIHLIFEILINFWTFFLCWCIYRSTIYMINYNCFFLFFGGWKSIFKLKLLIIILCLRFFFFFFLSLFWVNFWCFEIVDIGYDMILNHWIVWNSLMRVLIHWDKNKIIHIRYTCRCTNGKCLPLVIAIFHQHKP